MHLLQNPHFCSSLVPMSKARWTRWGGGHGRLDAYNLELGGLLTATVQRRPGDVWTVEINRRPEGEFPTKDAAMAEADARVKRYTRDFVEDWALWTISADPRFAGWKNG